MSNVLITCFQAAARTGKEAATAFAMDIAENYGISTDLAREVVRLFGSTNEPDATKAVGFARDVAKMKPKLLDSRIMAVLSVCEQESVLKIGDLEFITKDEIEGAVEGLRPVEKKLLLEAWMDYQQPVSILICQLN